MNRSIEMIAQLIMDRVGSDVAPIVDTCRMVHEIRNEDDVNYEVMKVKLKSDLQRRLGDNYSEEIYNWALYGKQGRHAKGTVPETVEPYLTEICRARGNARMAAFHYKSSADYRKRYHEKRKKETNEE